VRNQVVIENPVLNSAFSEPTRHFRFDDEGITDQTDEFRRPSAYFVPVPQPRKRGKQMVLDTQWTNDRVEENKLVNQIREKVGKWRKGRSLAVTKTTSRLLEYWLRQDRERKPFFCQVEALETAIYLTEVASKYGDQWMDNSIREGNAAANPLLYRMAFKMATGSGKTVVMAMLIAWHTLNKVATTRNLWIPAVNNDGRFGRWAFVEVTDPWDAENTIRAALRQQTAITEEA